MKPNEPEPMTPGHGNGLEAEHERAMEALRKAIGDLVECPDPVDGEVDEGTRMTGRWEAAAMAVAGLSAADAARALAHAALAFEEESEDGDGCLSMLVGEALRLLVMEQALDLADFDPARGLYEDDAGEVAF